jgi:hypothetical protein
MLDVIGWTILYIGTVLGALFIIAIAVAVVKERLRFNRRLENIGAIKQDETVIMKRGEK